MSRSGLYTDDDRSLAFTTESLTAQRAHITTTWQLKTRCSFEVDLTALKSLNSRVSVRTSNSCKMRVHIGALHLRVNHHDTPVSTLTGHNCGL